MMKSSFRGPLTKIAEKRIAKLKRELGGSFRKNLKRLIDDCDSPRVVDVVVFMPPDQNTGEVSTLAEVNKQGESMLWDFEIKKSQWSLRGDLSIDKFWFPKDLECCVFEFLRDSWSKLDFKTKREIVCYASIHDSSVFMNLDTGQRVKSRERVDFEPTKLKRIVAGVSCKKPSKSPFAIELGDTIGFYEKKLRIDFKIEKFGEGREVVDVSNQLGLWLMFYAGRLELVRFESPYQFQIEKIWLGCHASDVQRILGFPENEDYWRGFKTANISLKRCWLYLDFKLRVSFDKTDKVAMVEKGKNF